MVAKRSYMLSWVLGYSMKNIQACQAVENLAHYERVSCILCYRRLKRIVVGVEEDQMNSVSLKASHSHTAFSNNNNNNKSKLLCWGPKTIGLKHGTGSQLTTCQVQVKSYWAEF